MNVMDFTLEALETPALTKAHLADLLFEQIGLNKRESKDMVEAFFELVSASLIEGTDVKISGFGNFQIRVKAPRPGRNPRTGEAIPIGARRVATFHASAKLKEQIQGGMADEAESSEDATMRPRGAWVWNKCLLRRVRVE
jgi:integration host factor subunit alpha